MLFQVFLHANPKRDSAGSQNGTPAVVTRAERLPLTGSGNESRVEWRSTEETDQKALVVDAIDNCRTESIRVVYCLEGLGDFFVDKPVRSPRSVGVRSDHEPLVIQTQGLRPSRAGNIENVEMPFHQYPPMIHPVGVNEESANIAGIVDPGSLRTGRAGNVEQLENRAELVKDVSKIGSGAVCLGAVVAGSLAVVILAEELIKGPARKINCHENTSAIYQTMGVSCGANVKASGRGIVVDSDDLSLGRTREVLVCKRHAG